jgi:acyl homoserine lactone synthase
MFITIQAQDYAKHEGLLDQIFRLRKRVFHDELKWDVTAAGDYERDRYDDLGPVYIVWCDDRKRTLYGVMRLLPTTGPTLLYDVFRRTFPLAAELSAPGIWEATRTCIDAEALARDHPDIDPGKAFGLICLAACECALDHGIHTIVSNYEPHLKRVYRRAGVVMEELGKADGYGRRPVCCAAFEISKEVHANMQAALGVRFPLNRKKFAGGSTVAKPVPLAA